MTVGLVPPSPKQAGPGLAPALSGPTTTAPPATRAIEPPAPPTASTRGVGSRTSTPARLQLTVCGSRASSMIPMSMLVPPMSTVIASRSPRRSARARAPWIPLTGPELWVSSAWVLAIRLTPPSACTTSSGRARPSRRSRSSAR